MTRDLKCHIKRHTNLLLIGLALLITVVPLALYAGSADEGLFGGTDDAALGVIEQQAPGYVAWLDPVLEPAGGEVESMLFVVQAGLGFGFIGYYLGLVRGRRERAEDTSGEAEPTS